ncbi:MAG: SUMF1/EgtB/PvdO family nonheme iron enzyme [Magnetococcales bacterium]|nr:SUMF1/EgtB/PvdO family nonheme iron enzyme [Magnetococcales bacterium]
MNDPPVPIILIDMAGFSRLKTVSEQRDILLRLDDILVKVLRTFTGRVDPRRAFAWQSTGDGYYIPMEGYSSPEAMRFAVDLERALETDNARFPNAPLRLRVGLALGNVEAVGQHALSPAKTELNRLVDHPWPRILLAQRPERPLVLVTSTWFMDDWQRHPGKNSPEVAIPAEWIWTRVEFPIKDNKLLPGYIQETQEKIAKIIEGNPQAVPKVATEVTDLRPWMSELLERVGKLELRGISSGVGRGREAMFCDIEQLYTELRSRSGIEKRHNGGWGSTVRLSDLLPKATRLLIEGQPGAGKTTFLRLTAAMLAKDWLDIPGPNGDTWRHHYLGLTGEVLFPLFLRLSQLETHGLQNTHDTRHRLLDLLEKTTELPPGGRAVIEHLLDEGKVILLLDGLDEVTEASARDRLFAIFHDAAKHWHRCPLIVTSRPFGAAALRQHGFEHVVIDPFGHDQIRAFIDRWVTALIGEETHARTDRHTLQQAILDRPTIRLLAANPVMLTCLCVIHWNEGRLPEGRSRVYQAVLRWLIDARRRQRQSWFQRQPGLGDAMERVDESRFVFEAFATLALAMMIGKDNKKNVVYEVQDGAEVIQPLVARFFPSLKKNADQVRLGRQWLVFECLNSGIVEELGDQRLKFWHLTFQEYLAAYALTFLGDGEDPTEDWWPVIQPRLDDSQWRETVEFFPGALFDEGGRRRVDLLLNRVLAERGEQHTLAQDAKVAGILGCLLAPLGVYGYSIPPQIREPEHEIMTQVLKIFTLEGAAQVPITDRIAAAEALGRGGDPRLARELFADPKYLIEVPGTGGWRLRKFPVTVMEYQEFVDHGDGYRDPRWWDEQWSRIRDKRGWTTPEEWDAQLQYPTRPVTGVSWFEAMAYCRWLSDQKKMKLCLPAEVLWQKAAQPSTGGYPWGTPEPTPDLANFNRNVGAPTPVGIYPAGDGPCGHSDLAGNIWEWQHTIYQDNLPPLEETLPDPVVTKDDRLVLRGGSWFNPADLLRAAYRFRDLAGLRDDIFGFRVAVAPASL